MENQRCVRCGSEWNSSINSSVCPFCGSVLMDDSHKFATINEAFNFIFNEYGIDIIRDKRKFLSLLSDYVPSMENERRLVRIAVEADVYKTLLDTNKKDEAERNLCVKKMVAKLRQQCFLSIEWSQKVIGWFAEYLRWTVPFNIISTAPFSLTNASYSISSNEFDPAAYEAFSRDPNYVSAQKEVCIENYPQALKLYEVAYNKGNFLAGTKMALLYSYGYGTEVSKEKAYQIFSVVQKKGDPLAKAWIAEYYRMGYAVSQDKDKAKEILENCASDLEQMCACGDADAQYFLGFEYLYGLTLAKNECKSFELLKKSYASGNVSAGVALADCYLRGCGCAVDEKRGVTILETCIKSTNKKAHFELGKLYYYGKYVKQDRKRAFSLFMFAAERGHKSSQGYVGDCYQYGYGVTKDYIKAFEWYTKAYENGNIYAASQLGKMYCAGFGVQEDEDKAFYYFKYAADKGNTLSKYFLHYFYFAEGKYTNYEKGREYLLQAAEENNTEAQMAVAKRYCYGDYGFEKSEEKSYQWIVRAAELENAEAERIVGEKYMYSANGNSDPDKSRDWLEKAIEHGDLKAYVLIAKLYMDGELGSEDYKKGDEYLTACWEKLDKNPGYIKSGDIYKDMADVYYKYGTKQTSAAKKNFRSKATSIYQKLYVNGHINVLYDYAWGVFMDEVQPEQSFDPNLLVTALKEEAETKESSRCATLLATLYKEGYPLGCERVFLNLKGRESSDPIIKADKKESEKWVKVAIRNGDTSTACKYAIELCNNDKKCEEAFEYAKMAHEKGDYQGTFLLGQCYKKGIGVKKDRLMAKRLLKLAKENGWVDNK